MLFPVLFWACLALHCAATDAPTAWENAKSRFANLRSTALQSLHETSQHAFQTFNQGRERSIVWQAVEGSSLCQFLLPDTIDQHSGQQQPFVVIDTAAEMAALRNIMRIMHDPQFQITSPVLTPEDVRTLSTISLKYVVERDIAMDGIDILVHFLAMCRSRITMQCASLATRPDMYESTEAATAWVDDCASMLKKMADQILISQNSIWYAALLEQDCAFLFNLFNQAFSRLVAWYGSYPVVNITQRSAILNIAQLQRDQAVIELQSIERERDRLVTLIAQANTYQRLVFQIAKHILQLTLSPVVNQLSATTDSSTLSHADINSRDPSGRQVTSFDSVTKEIKTLFDTETFLTNTISTAAKFSKLTQLAFALRTKIRPMSGRSDTGSLVQISAPPNFTIFQRPCNADTSVFAGTYGMRFDPSGDTCMRLWTETIESAAKSVLAAKDMPQSAFINALFHAETIAIALSNAVHSYGAAQMAAFHDAYQEAQQMTPNK